MTIEEKEKSFTITAQYLKDISFENPKAPYSIMSGDKPSININLGLNAEPIHENTFEVVLHVQATATDNEEAVIFIVDVKYAGLFTIEGGLFSDEDKEAILMIHCPNLLFPYLRRIVSDSTRDGGYPPLMLSPINFLDLYKQKKANDSTNGSTEILEQ